MITLSANIIIGEETKTITNNASGSIGHLSTSAKSDTVDIATCINPKITAQSFVSSIKSNSQGAFSENIVVNVYGSSITKFLVVFDTLNDEYPTKLKIDGIEKSNDSALLFVDVPNGSSHSITVSEMNKPNIPLTIKGFYTASTVEIKNKANINIDKKNLFSIERNLSEKSDFELPSWGIISNRGEMSFDDSDGKIREYSKNLSIKSGMQTNVYLNNTLNGTKKQIALLYATDWEYKNDSNTVNVTIVDNLEEWQEIYVDALLFDGKNGTSMTASEIYNNIYSKTPSKYNMLSFDSLDTNTKEILNNIRVICPLIKQGTLWEQWSKFCVAFQCYIYKNGVGQTVCVHDEV